jgi:hypothetical protein
MSNYSETIIYKIVCKDESVTDCYVGHTTDFAQRKRDHRSKCLNHNSEKHNLKVYQTIRSNGGLDNWEMIEIEKYPCENSFQAREKERYWIETLKATLNDIIPNRTKQEYVDENKEHITEYKHSWYLKHKEELNEKGRQNYLKNKELRDEQNRKYQLEHKEELKEYRRLYHLRKKLEKKNSAP